MKYTVIHQRDKCIGCNACKEAAPGRWQLSKADGKSIFIGGQKKKQLYVGEIDEIELEDNLLAMKNCPVHVIQIRPQGK